MWVYPLFDVPRDDEGIGEFVAQAFEDALGGGGRIFPANEDAPSFGVPALWVRVAVTDGDVFVVRGELALQGFGAGFAGNGTHLDGELTAAEIRPWRRDYRDAYVGSAGAKEIDVASGGAREIDDASFDEGSAVGDADLCFFLRGEQPHADPSLEGKRWMSGGELFHVEEFPVGGAPAVIGFAVPTGDAFLGCVDARDGHAHGCAARAAGGEQRD